ncbi:MAG: rhomboid family intramembrane serine protease [Gammaproteobacteria bacterium]
MFPIRDENPQIRVPVVTYALLALNIAAWVLLQGAGSGSTLLESICRFGLIPADLLGPIDVSNLPERVICRIDGQPNWSTVVSSMFMHGGWMHLIGNLWFLWIFGDNVEDAMGRVRFAIFYLLCGLAAATLQVLSASGSVVPMVGASGAIGGVMGAYIVLYPRVHVHLLVILGFFVTTFAVPAVAMLGYWLVVQLLGGFSSIGASGGGVAFWAHVGGFAAGALLVLLFKDEDLLRQHPYRGWRKQTHADKLWRRVPSRRRSG